ncbi:hypothetical protein Tcan_01086, partial [Toxocara canis]
EELNRQPSRFEGTLSYALYSYSDEVVGSQCCQHQCGQLRHANAIFVYNKFDHRSLLERTVHKQFELLIGNATTSISSRLYYGRNSLERNLHYSIVDYFIQLFVVIVAVLCLVTFLKSKKYSGLWR